MRFVVLMTVWLTVAGAGRWGPQQVCCVWTSGGLAVPHNPAFMVAPHTYPELEGPETTIVGPAWPGTNCFGLALYPLYRDKHQEGLYLTDRAAEILCNTRCRRLRAGESVRRGDLLAYVVERPSAADPTRTVRALVHLATYWERSGDHWLVMSKFDSGPIYLLPPDRWPQSYPRGCAQVTLRPE